MRYSFSQVAVTTTNDTVRPDYKKTSRSALSMSLGALQDTHTSGCNKARIIQMWRMAPTSWIKHLKGENEFFPVPVRFFASRVDAPAKAQ